MRGREGGAFIAKTILTVGPSWWVVALDGGWWVFQPQAPPSSPTHTDPPHKETTLDTKFADIFLLY